MPVTAVQLLNNNVLPTFEQHGATVDAVLSDNGREFCGREDRRPYELFLQLEGIAHKRTRVSRPQSNGIVELHLSIGAASGNRFIRSIGGAIEVALQVSFVLSTPVNATRRKQMTLAHSDLVAAIDKRDASAAAEAMRAVIEFGMEQLGIKSSSRLLEPG